jgi:hypothetical protein
VTISITATPIAATCPVQINFVAHVTINTPGKYRWHWVFGGPSNYTAAGPDHDINKTGDVRITRKFDGSTDGAYWGQVQIVSPLALTSAPGTVDFSCP